MEETNLTQDDSGALSERLLTEVLRTPALKELVILLMKDIDPDAAGGLIKALLWEDAGVSMSLLGAIPDLANWLLELLLATGQQLNGLPAPLLRDFLVQIGAGIDSERLKELPQVYGTLAKRLLAGDDVSPEDAGALIAQAVNAALAGADQLTVQLDDSREEVARAIAVSCDELDTVSVGRILNRFLSLANSSRSWRQVPVKNQVTSVLWEVDAREMFAFLGGCLKDLAGGLGAFVTWSIRSLGGRNRR
jgi:hypothetical protein